ncbi:hypothetical protein K4F52_000931 [Lecanicillium sp. MT-2017a]|nr:hypothetical protein K4F52_000931 [Lecanicillium sp. MT-2017a]
MDEVLQASKNGWKSDRLVYRPLDFDDPQIASWMQNKMINDPVINSFAVANLFKPRTTKECTRLMEAFPTALIAVAVCLPRAADDAAADDERLADERKYDTADAPLPRKEQKAASQQPSTLKDTVIGFAALQPTTVGGLNHRAAEIGISLEEPYRGNGYGGEAIRWLTSWGFRFAGLHRVSLTLLSFNEHAFQLYKSLGFKEEGRARHAYYFDRKWYDAISMGLLEDEWEAMQEKDTA